MDVRERNRNFSIQGSSGKLSRLRWMKEGYQNDLTGAKTTDTKDIANNVLFREEQEVEERITNLKFRNKGKSSSILFELEKKS